MKTLDESKAELAAVNDAYSLFTNFYKAGAKAKLSLVEAAPNAYKGNQNAAGGIFAMLVRSSPTSPGL